MKTSKPDGNLREEVDRIETMINSPEVRDLRYRNRETQGYIRPRNASTMILLDGPSNDPRILMGRRNKNLKFMPGALVFPGGSVDRFDGSVPASSELTEITRSRLVSAMRGKATERGARGLAMAAIREVAEESGLLVGKRAEFDCSHPHWEEFKNRGIVPSLSGLRLFARAVTPPGMARRFDTWFFIAHKSSVGFVPEGGFSPDGELEDLQWIRPEDAITENTREITRVMLVELIQRLRTDKDLTDGYPAPYYHTKGSRFHKSEI
ncbi:MAG: NUDIX hydrolase [Rhizobiaceae bacterium]|nr:NUDIX hydrolase [Rhizobiaceae bacterium]